MCVKLSHPRFRSLTWGIYLSGDDVSFETHEMSGVGRLARDYRRPGTSNHHDSIRLRKAQGGEVLAVSSIPPWPPPVGVFESAYERFSNDPSMSPLGGFESLRETISEKRRRSFAAEVRPEEVLVTNGAKEAIHLVLAVLCEPRASVLVPAPNYIYEGNCEILGLQLHQVPEDPLTRFPDVQHIVADIERTRPHVVLTSSPINPTGYVWTRAELEQLAESCERVGAWLVLDESFEELVDQPMTQTSGDLLRKFYPRTVTLHSFSKGYGMTWARLGYVVADQNVVMAASKLQEWISLRVNTFGQYLAEEALRSENDGWLAVARERSFASRRLVLEALASSSGAHVVNSSGGGSAFVYLAETSRTGQAVSKMLLESYGIAALPGSMFGAGGESVRIPSIASRPDLVEELCNRLRSAFDFDRELHR